MGREAIYLLVDGERISQEKKHGGKTCASRIEDLYKLSVLLEEVGEVAAEVQAIADYEREGQHKMAEVARRKLADELIQVTACSVAWLEALFAISTEPN